MNRISGSEKGKLGGWYRSIGWIYQSARRLCAYNGRSEASTKRPPGYGKPIADHSIYPEISHLRHGKVIQATCGVAVGGLANFSSRMTAEPQLIREDPSQRRHVWWKVLPKIIMILDLEQEFLFRTTVFLRLDLYLQRLFLSHFSYRLHCHSSHLTSPFWGHPNPVITIQPFSLIMKRHDVT